MPRSRATMQISFLSRQPQPASKRRPATIDRFDYTEQNSRQNSRLAYGPRSPRMDRLPIGRDSGDQPSDAWSAWMDKTDQDEGRSTADQRPP